MKKFQALHYQLLGGNGQGRSRRITASAVWCWEKMDWILEVYDSTKLLDPHRADMDEILRSEKFKGTTYERKVMRGEI